MANMPAKFTEAELEAYLNDRRKIVDILLNIGINFPNEKIGVVLKREYIRGCRDGS